VKKNEVVEKNCEAGGGGSFQIRRPASSVRQGRPSIYLQTTEKGNKENRARGQTKEEGRLPTVLCEAPPGKHAGTKKYRRRHPIELGLLYSRRGPERKKGGFYSSLKHRTAPSLTKFWVSKAPKSRRNFGEVRSKRGVPVGTLFQEGQELTWCLYITRHTTWDRPSPS